MRSKFVSLLLTVITYIALVGCSIPDNTIETPPTEASTTATLAQTTVLELDSTTEATTTPLSTKINRIFRPYLVSVIKALHQWLKAVCI